MVLRLAFYTSMTESEKQNSEKSGHADDCNYDTSIPLYPIVNHIL
jgi:hypothetical protein